MTNTRLKRMLANVVTDTSGKWVSIENVEILVEDTVRRCAKIAWINTPDTEELEYGHKISDKITNHFGLES